jgi:hypothetical protein
LIDFKVWHGKAAENNLCCSGSMLNGVVIDTRANTGKCGCFYLESAFIPFKIQAEMLSEFCGLGG